MALFSLLHGIQIDGNFKCEITGRRDQFTSLAFKDTHYPAMKDGNMMANGGEF